MAGLRLVDLLPRPDSTIPEDRPQISASFAGGIADPNSVHVSFDGRDVTGQSYVSPRDLRYRPDTPVPGGSHEVVVTGRTRDGAPFRQRWEFVTERR